VTRQVDQAQQDATGNTDVLRTLVLFGDSKHRRDERLVVRDHAHPHQYESTTYGPFDVVKNDP